MKKHTHTVTRGDRTYTIRVCEDDLGYTIRAELDPSVDPDKPHIIHCGGLSEIVWTFAQWQLSVPDVCEDPIVSFVDEASGQLIVSPWYDPSGRFLHSTLDAVKMYGTKNVADFISQSIIFLFDLKEV